MTQLTLDFIISLQLIISSPRVRQEPTCLCQDDYGGSRCEIPVNECEASPCEHGGTCRQTELGPVCMCAPGWTGSYCGEDVNECAQPPAGGPACRNGGTCTNTPGSFTCQCTTYYTGKLQSSSNGLFRQNLCGNGTRTNIMRNASHCNLCGNLTALFAKSPAP